METENLYISQITECHNLVNEISKKISFISSNYENKIKEEVDRPSVSMLDAQLMGLVEHLRDVKTSINI